MTKLYEMVVNSPKITSGFGYRLHPIYKTKKFHNGLDLISKKSDHNLKAIDDGYVQKVVTGQDKSKTGFGNYVWIRYPRYNLSLLYAHCKSIKVKKGDKVSKGKVVAIMGSTGASTGTHLHLGMTYIGKDTWLNPANYDEISDKFNLTRPLKVGSSGSDVKQLQTNLKKLGYTGKPIKGKKQTLSIDGSFGANTKYAVTNFQKDNKLTADGIVGKSTAHKLGWLYKNK